MIRHLLWILLLPRASPGLFNIYRNCDYYQRLRDNTRIKLTSPGYPDSYPPGSKCRWSAESPPNTVIHLECYLNLASNSDCKKNNLKFSDNKNLKNARCYCGNGEFHYLSLSNQVFIVLRSSSSKSGGWFYCELEARPSRSTQTAPTAVGLPTSPPNDESPTDRPPEKCTCGRTNSPRIIGGETTVANEFPMMAGFFKISSGKMFCGGTIISKRYVVSAGHCFDSFLKEEVQCLVGGHDYTRENAYHTVCNIADIILPDGYTKSNQNNDISLVKTIEPMHYSYGVHPACLPYKLKNYDFMSETVTIAGWGLTDSNSKGSRVLQKTMVSKIPHNICQKIFSIPDDKTEICMYGGTKSPCKGDSGGPILWRDPQSDAMLLVGVVKKGLKCSAEYPSIGTEILFFLDWIEEVTGEEFCKI